MCPCSTKRTARALRMIGSVVVSKCLRSWWLAKAITASTSIGVHDDGGSRVGVGDPKEAEVAVGVEGGWGESSSSSE